MDCQNHIKCYGWESPAHTFFSKKMGWSHVSASALKSLEYLDLDYGKEIVPDYSGIAPVVDRFSERLMQVSFSIREYQEYALYDPDFGYYTRNVKIGSSDREDIDFVTEPMTMSSKKKYFPSYGGIWAEFVFDLWKNMLKEGVLRKEERLNVFEFGAGMGMLAYDFLLHASQMAASKREDWEEFYQSLRYIIGEISPHLRQEQEKALKQFDNRVEILDADVRNIKKTGQKGVILTNELPDAFPMHIIKYFPNSGLKVGYCVPIMKKFDKLSLDLASQSEIENEQWFFKNCGLNKKDYGGYFLSKQTYTRLRKKYLNLIEVRWLKIWLPAHQKINKFAERHPEFCRRIFPGKEYTLNTDLKKFQKRTGALLSEGYKITIDYQYDNDQMIRMADTFRCYPREHKAYLSQKPGDRDITGDVNASALVEEGRRVGWKKVWYGNEANLIPSYLVRAIQWNDIQKNKIVSKHRMIRYHQVCFNVLIERKKSTISSLAFSHSEPVSYRELFLSKIMTQKPGSMISPLFSEHPFITPIARKLGKALYSYVRVLPEDFSLCLNENNVNQEMTKHAHAILQTAELHKGPLSIYYRHALDKMMGVFECLFTENGLLHIASLYPSQEEFDFESIKHFFSIDAEKYEPDPFSDMIIRQFLYEYYLEKEPKIVPDFS